ncbi:MAG: Flp pilus assembly complex ATPase component TadA [Burkholderiaceae bacterium]|nr:Flp pilus assembly complex ATPase component TadA [Burkholderiaceae bacterium]
MADSTALDTALGHALLARQLITRLQLDYAKRKHDVIGGSLAGLLVRQGLIDDRAMSQVLAEVRGLPWQGDSGALNADVLALFRREACSAMSMLPLAVADGVVTLWIGETDPEQLVDWVQRRLGLRGRCLQGPFGAVGQAIEQAYAGRRDDVRALFERERRRIEQDEDGSLGTEALMQSLIGLAALERATDIHIAPDADALLLSFRVDGILLPVVAMSRRAARLVAAIKVAAGMDISDNLRPQDGRFTHTHAGGTIDVRVSTIVTPFGESVALRLLHKGHFIGGLEDLGFYPEHVPRLNALFQQPYGIVLLTGPTGSGKTTTLYAGLRPLGLTGRSILSVEDPVEYDLPGACQTQVNRKAGYSFDTAIRHFLRHDPDIMLVGEIRDSETAEAAIRASETGHLVLSTLHVNNVLSVPRRLASLGVPLQSVADTLTGIVTQRLVRKLCDCCRQPDPVADADLPAALRGRLDGARLYRPVGCAECDDTGYRGRLPVYEMLLLDLRVADWIAAGAHRGSAASVLNKDNHVRMLDVFIRRLLDGTTSLAEFGRAFGVFDDLMPGAAAPQ